MTRPRNWWVEEEDCKWYLFRTPPDSTEGTREPDTPLKKFEVYALEGTPNCIKVCHRLRPILHGYRPYRY